MTELRRVFEAGQLAVFAVLLAAAVAGVAAARQPLLVAGAVALAAGSIGLFLLPRRYWPPLAMALFMAIPIRYLGLPDRLTWVTPATAVVVAWASLAVVQGRVAPRSLASPLLGTLAMLTLWLLVSSAFGTSHRDSERWMAGFACGVLAFVVGSRARGVNLVVARDWFLVTAAGVAVLACIETYVLKNNPIFGSFYATAGSNSIVQYDVWSTYRATTTLGHPLLNGTVFAVAGALALGRYLEARARWSLLAAIACFGGVVATGSRSAFAAIVVAAAVIIALGIVSQASLRRRAVFLISAAVLVFGATGTLLISSVVERADSNEAERSSQGRAEFRRNGLALLEQNLVVGTGPAGLTVAAEAAGIASGGNFENSYLEFAIAAGVPGLLLLLSVYSVALRSAYRARDIGLVGGLIAYLVCQGAFNLVQAYPDALVLMGFLLALAAVAERTLPSARPTAA